MSESGHSSVTFPDDLIRVLDRESQEIIKSRAAFERDEELAPYLRLMHAAIQVLAAAIVTQKRSESSVEVGLRALTVVILNGELSALSLLMRGYLAPSVGQIRSILEAAFLFEYLARQPDKLGKWLDGERFAPKIVRAWLDERDGLLAKRRARHYDILSNLGSHPSAESVRRSLTLPNGDIAIAPQYLHEHGRHVLAELSMVSRYAADAFLETFESPAFEDAVVEYSRAAAAFDQHMIALRQEVGLPSELNRYADIHAES